MAVELVIVDVCIRRGMFFFFSNVIHEGYLGEGVPICYMVYLKFQYTPYGNILTFKQNPFH